MTKRSTVILSLSPDQVRRGDTIRAVNGQLLPSPMTAVADYERAADGVPRVPIQAPRGDVEWNWYPATSGATTVTIERQPARRFRTKEGAAKALAQEAGVRGFSGGFLGLPADMPPADVRAVATRLGVGTVKITDDNGDLMYWRVVVHAAKPYRWPELVRRLLARGMVVPETATSKMWKWADTL